MSVVTGDNAPWTRDGWTLPPRCCGTFAADPHSCEVCGNAVLSLPATIVLGEN